MVGMAAIHAIRTWTCPPPWHAPAPNWSSIQRHDRGPRDILVFASGERDIHDFENALRRHYGPRAADMRRPDAIEIVPLFATALLEGAA